jgi:hypothetical protein
LSGSCFFEGLIDLFREKVSLGVSTVEANQDQDVSIDQDSFLKPVKIFSTVETPFVFAWV